MINKNMIALNEDISTAEEAIKRAGKLLLENEYITEKYIHAMIDTYKKNGAYIVIAPKFALPHARPENGVIKAGFSILTLKNGINFGNEENDPVKLIVALAASNSDEHIQVIQKLTTVFSDKEKTNIIFNTDNKDEIIKILMEE